MSRSRDVLGSLRRVAALSALAALLGSAPVAGQSLGAVAKEAETQRKATKSSGKVYTNDQLKSDPRDIPSSAPVPSAGPTATPPTPSGVGADDKAKQDAAGKQTKDEAYWRDRIKAERDALARAETFAAALQSQINGLYGEFTACQAPPQCNEISAKRQKSLSELDRVKKEIAQHTKGIADIQEEARRAGVPAGWVR